MAFKYAKEGPPFNFLGTLTETQRDAFYKWIDKHVPNFDPIMKFHRVRAHQLRKTSGILEEYYKSEDPLKRKLKPTFEKDAWKPPAKGHFNPIARDDKHPANVVFEIKDRMQDQLALDDEAVFRMNWVRNRFEAHEDMAQEHKEGPDTVAARRKDLDRYFADPYYRFTLPRDKSDKVLGGPTARVHHLDAPTPIEQRDHDQELPK